VKDLYSENYKSLKKEVEKYIRLWKDLSWLCISRTNIMKMGVLPKVIYMFNAILIRIAMSVLTEVEKS
jgi:hypothetical protein